MGLQEEITLIRNIPFFSKTEASKLKSIALSSEQVEYKAGEYLCHQGDVGKVAYILIKGTADVIVDTDEGPLHVNELVENDVFGEVSVLCDVPRNASLLAKTDIVTLHISKELFFKLIEDFPLIGIELMREMAFRFDITVKKLCAVAHIE